MAISLSFPLGSVTLKTRFMPLRKNVVRVRPAALEVSTGANFYKIIQRSTIVQQPYNKLHGIVTLANYSPLPPPALSPAVFRNRRNAFKKRLDLRRRVMQIVVVFV